MKLTPEFKEIVLDIASEILPGIGCTVTQDDFVKFTEAFLAALPKPKPVAVFIEDYQAEGGARFKMLAPIELETNLYSISLDQAAEIERLTKELEILKESRDWWIAEYGNQVTRTNEEIHISRKLKAQIAELLAAIEAKDAALRKCRFDSLNMTFSLWEEIKTAFNLTPSAELLETRDRNLIAEFVYKFKRHVGGDGEFWLHELEDFEESGEWQPDLKRD
jgi:hypothetical protein